MDSLRDWEAKFYSKYPVVGEVVANGVGTATQQGSEVARTSPHGANATEDHAELKKQN
jgi:hypothetical protein